MSNFIEKCQASEVGYDDIDDFIDAWHGNPQGKALYDFLGMTRKEYALWIADASILAAIVTARSRQRTLDDLLEEFAEQLPHAKSATGERSTQELANWLKNKFAPPQSSETN